MYPRKAKQLIYGAGFIAVFGGILALIIYFLFLKPAPTCFDNIQNQNETGVDCGGVCAISCEQKYAQPLVVNFVKKIKDGGNKVILLAEVKNPNFDYASDDFVYSFNTYDISGNKIQSITGHSFIYAGETKNLFEVIDADKNEISEDLTFLQYDWKSKDSFKNPDVEIKSSQVNINAAGSVYPLTVTGVVKNNDFIKVSKVILSAFVYDSTGTLAGVSKTELENFNPTDERNFTIIFPTDIDTSLINQNATKVYVNAIR